MDFYEVNTDEGPQLLHRKDEAKKADPKFRKIEVKTDKASLMARLNDLMRRAHAAGSSTAPGADEPGEQRAPQAAEPAPSMPPHAQRNEAQIAWEEFLLAVPDNEAYRLDALQKAIDGRRSEIEAASTEKEQEDGG